MDHALQKRSLVGVGLIAAGALLLLGRLHLMHIDWPTLLWGGLALLGVYRVVLGFTQKGRGVFIGTAAAAVGTYALLRESGAFFIPHELVLPSMILLAGLGIFLTFLAAPQRWHLLVPALLLLALGGALVLAEEGYLDAWEVLDLLRIWWPLALVLFGIALLLNRDRNRTPMQDASPREGTPSA